MDDYDIKIEPLTSKNYWEWSIRMKAVLILRDLDDCIWRDAKDLTQEERRDRKAWALIVLHVSDKMLPLVADLDSGKEAWDKLKTVFEGTPSTPLPVPSQVRPMTRRNRPRRKNREEPVYF